MAFTYDPSQLANSPLFQVRFQVGDTVPGKSALQDGEIQQALAIAGGTIFGAAEVCCRALAALYARDVDTVQQDMRTMYSSRSKRYSAMADEFRRKLLRSGGGSPYAGGISIMDKLNQDMDCDRVQPQFVVGMTDDDVPFGPTPPQGEETSDDYDPNTTI